MFSEREHFMPKAQVAELVDAHVSGACAARREGSSPFLGTARVANELTNSLLAIYFFFQFHSFTPQKTKEQEIVMRLLFLLLFGGVKNYFPNFKRSFSIMWVVIDSRSYLGAQSHSMRAQVSSSLLGHESAMP